MPDAHSLDPTAPGAPLPHGGDLADAAAAAPRHQGPWLDLSTGVNPWPYPSGAVPEPLWTRLPGRALLDRLTAAAARAYGVSDPAGIVAAPGSQALIQWLPRLRAPGRIAVLGPTYGEHERSWRMAGHAVTQIEAPEALADPWDAAVVTNPNNPDGRLIGRDRLIALAGRLAARGAWLVVDEAFADTDPAASLAPDALRPGLVVLRSFGKFFGLPGLRLGFALAEPALAARLRAALGPWPVSGPAAWIGAEALADSTWIEATRLRLAESAARLDSLLGSAGLETLGGTSLFRLAGHPRAASLHGVLLGHGIYARAFPEQPRWLRFGLPADGHGLARLERALIAVRQSDERHA